MLLMKNDVFNHCKMCNRKGIYFDDNFFFLYFHMSLFVLCWSYILVFFLHVFYTENCVNFHSSQHKMYMFQFCRCDVIINIFQKASKVQVLSDTCEDCGSQIVTVDYKEVMFKEFLCN